MVSLLLLPKKKTLPQHFQGNKFLQLLKNSTLIYKQLQMMICQITSLDPRATNIRTYRTFYRQLTYNERSILMMMAFNNHVYKTCLAVQGCSQNIEARKKSNLSSSAVRALITWLDPKVSWSTHKRDPSTTSSNSFKELFWLSGVAWVIFMN